MPAESAASTRVLILGYGAFGRAVHAALTTRTDLSISIYSRSARSYQNPPAEVFADASRIPMSAFDIVIVALPGHAIREVLSATRVETPAGTAFLSCVKGMDPNTGRLPSEVIYEATRSASHAVMSGASFADEMLAGRPVFLTLACANASLGRDLVDRLENPMLAMEVTDDVRGLEIAGVGKNIIALGAGMAEGVGLGDNFRATFIARGIVELREAAERLGGRAETIVAAGALADFILSCSSPRSRNFSHGLSLAQGLSEPVNLAEGWQSASSFVDLLRAHGISSPYFETIAASLAEPGKIAEALATYAGRRSS